MASIYEPPFFDSMHNWFVRLQLVDYPVHMVIDTPNDRENKSSIHDLVVCGIKLASFISVPNREGYLLTHLYRSRLKFAKDDESEYMVCNAVSTSQILDFDSADRSILTGQKRASVEEWSKLHKRLTIAVGKFARFAHLSFISAQFHHKTLRLVDWKIIKQSYCHPTYAARLISRREYTKKVVAPLTTEELCREMDTKAKEYGFKTFNQWNNYENLKSNTVINYLLNLLFSLCGQQAGQICRIPWHKYPDEMPKSSGTYLVMDSYGSIAEAAFNKADSSWFQYRWNCEKKNVEKWISFDELRTLG